MTFGALLTSLQLVDISIFVAAMTALWKVIKTTQVFEFEHRQIKEDLSELKQKIEDMQDKCGAHHTAHYCIKHGDILKFLNPNDA